ncbi:MAG: DNA replication and repair protein RecF [Sphaerochaetaceae bacterium]|nr:DNA replication and repair protein RecF [Sphaerochaetaceae bacterium]
MLIRTLVYSGFRNLRDGKLDVSSKQVILKGENGQGKTNLLEALYILCYGSSFRTQNLKDAVKKDSDYFSLRSFFTDSNGLPRSNEVDFDGSEKTIIVDGKQIRDRKELIYTVPCIVFSHDDMEIVRGEPENRRKFFNQILSMYDPVYFEDFRKYSRLLRQRNTVIKDRRLNIIDVYDTSLAKAAIPLIKKRREFCDEFFKIFPSYYSKVSGYDSSIKIEYRPSWSDDMSESDIEERLINQRETDIRMNTTTSGPHRDKFVITDEKGIFANTASTGQMRLASLILRSAQAQFYREKTGQDPVILIDDVLLELDSQRRARYLEALGNYSQAFFTFLPEEKYFSDMLDLSDTKIYNVSEGGFELESER